MRRHVYNIITVCGERGKPVHVPDLLAAMERVTRSPGEVAAEAVFTPTVLLAACENGGTVTIYDLRTGASVRKIQPGDTGDEVSSAAFSRSSSSAAVLSSLVAIELAHLHV